MPGEKTSAARPGVHRTVRSVDRRNIGTGPVAGIALLVVALMFAASGARAQEPPADRYTVTFFSKPTTVRTSPDGRELLVVFPGALPDGEVDRVTHALGTLLDSYAEGYGAIRFRLTMPIRASLASSSDRRTIEVVPEASARASLEDERRLQLLKAREQAREGDVAGARANLQRIVAERPQDIEPRLALADTEIGVSRWQHALGLYDGILRLFPEATDIGRDRTGLMLQHAPSVRTDGGLTFGPGGERAQSATVSGDMPLGETWRVGASVQTTHDTIRGLRRSGSAGAADYDGTKLLQDLSLTHQWQSPTDTTRIDVYTALRTVGASFSQTLGTSLGLTTVGGYYHQPYWGTVMAFAANARRDQLGVAHGVSLPDRWQAQIGAGLIRYGLPGYDSVAAGPSALAGISRGLPDRWMPLQDMQVRLGYRLEAEYLSNVQTGSTSAGPLPLLDVRKREVHSLYADSSTPIGPGLATVSMGYALDRFGGGGPQALIRYSGGQDSDRLSFSVEAGLGPSLDVRTRTLFHLGGSLVWRLGE